MHANHIHQDTPGPRPLPTRPVKGAIAMLIVIAMFYLLREHWGHVLGALPYLLLLACPLMHLFGHGQHNHGQHATEGDRKDTDSA